MTTPWRHVVPVRPLGERRIRIRRWLRVIGRGLALLLWTLVSIPVQGLLNAVPGRSGRVRFARIYWHSFCRLIGLKVRVLGVSARGNGRRVVYVSNHSSWLDIPVLGGTLEACFIAKAEVGAWPMIRTIARLGRTIFVSRRKSRTGVENAAILERLAAGDDLILFPEGTTSDGARVLPFRSSFFALAETPNPPMLQPVSVVYDRLDGLPALRATRPLFAWYGDMEIGPHFWRLAQHHGLRASVLLHEPVDPLACPDRKLLARALWQVVAEGAANLRQNRPAAPLSVRLPPMVPTNGSLTRTTLNLPNSTPKPEVAPQPLLRSVAASTSSPLPSPVPSGSLPAGDMA
ncbi:MAG TPA: lysophospholipid acyltransferase family protein [Acetobacteraceae bacterium]|nr:lysophospholipid acyltransferase family protein [Acetobacteraceae bacterium]